MDRHDAPTVSFRSVRVDLRSPTSYRNFELSIFLFHEKNSASISISRITISDGDRGCLLADRHQIEFWLMMLVRICRQVTNGRFHLIN